MMVHIINFFFSFLLNFFFEIVYFFFVLFFILDRLLLVAAWLTITWSLWCERSHGLLGRAASLIDWWAANFCAPIVFVIFNRWHEHMWTQTVVLGLLHFVVRWRVDRAAIGAFWVVQEVVVVVSLSVWLDARMLLLLLGRPYRHWLITLVRAQLPLRSVCLVSTRTFSEDLLNCSLVWVLCLSMWQHICGRRHPFSIQRALKLLTWLPLLVIVLTSWCCHLG